MAAMAAAEAVCSIKATTLNNISPTRSSACRTGITWSAPSSTNTRSMWIKASPASTILTTTTTQPASRSRFTCYRITSSSRQPSFRPKPGSECSVTPQWRPLSSAASIDRQVPQTISGWFNLPTFRRTIHSNHNNNSIRMCDKLKHSHISS